MASKYWIKLYLEILNDRKVARLTTHLRWRMIECFLLAGDHQADGLLPKLEDSAWLLRVDETDLEKDWQQLAEAGILKKTKQGWVVINYQKRQAAATSTERWQEWQKRQMQGRKSNVSQTTNNQSSNLSLVDQIKIKNRSEKKRKETDQNGGVGGIFEIFGVDPNDVDSRITKSVENLIKLHGEPLIYDLANKYGDLGLLKGLGKVSYDAANLSIGNTNQDNGQPGYY